MKRIFSSPSSNTSYSQSFFVSSGRCPMLLSLCFLYFISLIFHLFYYLFYNRLRLCYVDVARACVFCFPARAVSLLLSVSSSCFNLRSATSTRCDLFLYFDWDREYF